ncbi:serine/threonine protein kinase [Microbacteriaceae bacterium VKM Ac-2854]|nr:serine/threonine protein kinase [Microbacteriaceae bacterium VKM Ac-2854]
MVRRLPSAPPNLSGFSYIHILGAGGFADVFLYSQSMPRRQVAVKVLVTDVVSSRVVSMFQTEADLMAQLSAHPAILTVYEAGVAADGRPYLVMELCSSELNERYRAAPLPLAEVLHIAVKIGSAIETAHRAGVLHRDIKPSNILTTAYGHPVLADFGIASTFGEDSDGHTIGLSVPWSAPEVVHGSSAGTVASEVWSLGATVYSLLAGRSPFEIPGRSNDAGDLVDRIGRSRPGPLGRPDAPPALERVLLRALSRDPGARQGSALELVHQLQAVEAELGLVQTAADVVVDGWATSVAVDPLDRTRLVEAAPVKRRSRGRADPDPLTPPDEAPVPVPDGRGVRLTAWLVIGCAVLTLALAGTSIALLLRSAPAASTPIPAVDAIESHLDGGAVVFTWQDPGIEPGDSYVIRTEDGRTSTQRSARFVVDPGDRQQVCVTVTVNRGGRSGEPSSEKCAEADGSR